MSEPNHLYHQALSSNRKLLEENARLKAENERLRKAGDAMADNLYIPVHHATYLKLLSDWNAAKEGKQP